MPTDNVESPSRKTYTRREDIPEEVRRALSAGVIETRTLAESLVVEFDKLFAASFPHMGREPMQQLREAADLGIVARMELAGRLLTKGDLHLDCRRLANHKSDIVRGWACYWVRFREGLSLSERFETIRPFAADRHFGVREWAWMAMRPFVIEQLEASIRVLKPWVLEADPNLRRFAVELTRPRGVWCPHIAALKEQPETALPLLEPVRNDQEKYVQDSVANWLNDAAKSQPEWVQTTCERWLGESDSKATRRICKRGQRSMK